MKFITLNCPVGTESASAMKRRCGHNSGVRISTDLELCDAIDLRDFAHVAVLVPPKVTSLLVLAAGTPDGPFYPIGDLGASGHVIVTGGQWVTLQVAPYPFIKLKAEGADGRAVVVGKT